MIKNVVFDIGRVLVEYEPKKYLKSFGYSEEKIEELYVLIFQNKIWSEFDRGTYTYQQGINIFCEQRPELTEDIKKILHLSWLDILVIKKETEDFLRKLKETGYKIFFLSNFSKEGFEYIENKYDFFELQDGKIISGQVGLIKPEPEIYKLLLDKYNLIPQETLFIDDMEENLIAAEYFNIRTIQFTNISEVLDKFEKLIACED